MLAPPRRSEALRRLLAHAYTNVDYYRELFDRAGVRPDDVRSTADLAAIPRTGKQDLRSRPLEQIVAAGVDPDRLRTARTSGSTGEPFVIRRTHREQLRWVRPWIPQMRRCGWRAWRRAARILYRHHDEPARPLQRLVQASGLVRMRKIDCCQPPEVILQELRAFRPDLIIGLPGVIYRVARRMTDTDRAARWPRGLLVSGEALTEAMRSAIAEAFGAPVRSAYASHEFGLMATECDHRMLHVTSDDVVLEVVRPDGRPAAPGERGEVLATALHAYAAPLIRYALGDIATRGPATCACGDPSPTLAAIEGRVIDYFRLRDGTLLHPYQIAGPVVRHAPWVGRYQLVQEREDRIVLHALPAAQPPPADEVRRLERAIAHRLDGDVEFRVRVVAEIANPSGGKTPLTRTLVRTERGDPHATQREAQRVFAHCPTASPGGADLARILPRADRYPERALLLARPDDVVCVFEPPDREHLRFLNRLGIGPHPANVVVIPRRGDAHPADTLSPALLSDGDARQRVVDRLTRDEVVLDCFVATEHDHALAQVLERTAGRPVSLASGPVEMVQRIYPKHEGLRLARRAGVPVAPGTVVELPTGEDGRPADLAPLQRAMDRFAHDTGRIIVRGSVSNSGSSTFVAAANGEDAARLRRRIAARRDNDVYLVGPFVAATASPNIQVLVEPAPGRVRCVGVTDQILDADLRFVGSRQPSTATRIADMTSSAVSIGRVLQDDGFAGLVGLDFVEYQASGTQSAEYFLVEINPRTNGATYPSVVAARLNDRRQVGTSPIEAFVSAHAPTDARSFRDLEDRCGDLLLEPGGSSGLIPYNLGCLGAGRVGLISVAATASEASSLFERACARVAPA